mmetsp:Transcript_19234/g.46185  ORF Transcript_19234/g.46185 Transcript_19234/m.46185 type:complete len:80 (-) Transcript_19234:162-401(-)
MRFALLPVERGALWRGGVLLAFLFGVDDDAAALSEMSEMSSRDNNGSAANDDAADAGRCRLDSVSRHNIMVYTSMVYYY